MAVDRRPHSRGAELGDKTARSDPVGDVLVGAVGWLYEFDEHAAGVFGMDEVDH
jgi:hypothetical protein